MKLYPQLLSIVIPTFNRSNYLDNQIEWAIASINGNWDEVELVVCDNASTDGTIEVCSKWKKRLGLNLKVFRNDKNVGLVKNCLLAIERAGAKYVWLVGDDDPVDKDAVSDVLSVLNKYPLVQLLHLNHRCIDGKSGNIITPAFYQQTNDIYEEKAGAHSLNGILQQVHTGGFMFITANVLNRQVALNYIKNNPPREDMLLAYPLYLNLGIAANSPFYLIASCIVDCVYNQSSWSEQYNHVNYIEVPEVLVMLAKKGMSKAAIRFCLSHQFAGVIGYRDMLYTFRKNRKSISRFVFKTWWKLIRLKTYFECKLVLQ